ncbi:MAG: M20/M25/M40 family metallo-hydrolase [Herpetosiphon sp.]
MTSLPAGYDWNNSHLQAALDTAASTARAVATIAREICTHPAPTFHEAERAAYIAAQWSARGVQSTTDTAGNVIVRRPGAQRRSTVLLAAHIDTVFPPETPVTVREADGRLVGPGIGDNSLGVAALLHLFDLLNAAGLETRSDMLFCATTGEEGLGNLRGIRQVVDDYRDELGSVIGIEGHGLGRVIHQAVGSRRLRITVEGPGGHSWTNYGVPSAIHVLSHIMQSITELSVPTDPKTTLNIGTIEGGVSVNTIAPSASFVLDMRSVDAASLAALVARVEEIIGGSASDQIRVQSQLLGDRPAGGIAPTASIVQAALGALDRTGIASSLDAGSTDINIPLALGIPSVCVGITDGGRAHHPEEYIEIAPIAHGLQQLVRLVSVVAGIV